MSDKIKDGGPAFPNGLCDSSSGAFHLIDGMSLRDYFAAKAMQGVLISMSLEKTENKTTFIDEDYMSDVSYNEKIEEIAWYSYTIADAMLKAREENGK